MALIKCPECGKEISDRATSCPHCGFPIVNATQVPKEYRIELSVFMRIEATEQSVKVFYNNRLIVEAPVSDFVLNYNREESADAGRPQLRVAFSCPQYKDAFTICVNTTSEKYANIKGFVDNVADKHFKKDYVDNWYIINDYARSHVDQSKIDEMNAHMQSSVQLKKPLPQQQPKPIQEIEPTPKQKEPQPQQVIDEENEPFWKSTAFTIVMFLFLWPVGLFTMWKYKHFKKGTRIAWSIILPLLALFIIVTPFASDSPKSSTVVKQNNSYEQEVQDLANEISEDISSDGSDYSETNEPADTSQSDVITVGSSFEVDGLQITVNDANTDFRDYDDEYGIHALEDGMKYVKATFTYENLGNSDKYASIYDFDCYADNQTCEQAYGLDDNSFLNTNLSSGRSVSFSTYYTVPVNAQSIELEYTANIWTSEKVLIKLQ